MIRTIAVEGYRSLRDLELPLGQLDVITGANGSGKSSVYRSLRLLADVAQNEVIASLAREGRAAVHVLGWSRDHRTQRSPENLCGPAPCKRKGRQPEAGIRGRYVRLQHRSGIPTAAQAATCNDV